MLDDLFITRSLLHTGDSNECFVLCFVLFLFGFVSFYLFFVLILKFRKQNIKSLYVFESREIDEPSVDIRLCRLLIN